MTIGHNAVADLRALPIHSFHRPTGGLAVERREVDPLYSAESKPWQSMSGRMIIYERRLLEANMADRVAAIILMTAEMS
jgi:hypothetical protein